jgi:hypothetical protein
MKVNTNGATVINPDVVFAGGIFRNENGVCSGCFAQRLGPREALFAELIVAMIAIKIAASKGYTSLWLESDSCFWLSNQFVSCLAI